MAIAKTILKTADVLKRLKARPKTKTPKETTPKEAGLVRGAGDKSDPTVGRYGAGQKSGRGGATKTATQAMRTTEKDKLARKLSAKKSLERYEKLKPGSIEQLKDEYHHLNKGDQRAERLKGSKSKFYKVFKDEGMKPVSPTSKKASKALGLKGGGMTRAGLYPAEMARAGTMSQAKRKRYMKKGGGISYKMTGGQVVSHGYD